MAEKPILFSGDMVRAILNGAKTMTRRVVKPQPDHRHCRVDFENGVLKESSQINGCWSVGRKIKCPYGKPGDILYVRETWYYEDHMHDLTAGEPDLPGGLYSHHYIYRASSPDYPVDVGVGQQGWRPSIHMPKSAARLFLTVKDVRVERIDEISEVDAKAEGVDTLNGYRALWDKLNEKRGFPWSSRCWVWVVTFQKV
jgi:hypothetical protein